MMVYFTLLLIAYAKRNGLRECDGGAPVPQHAPSLDAILPPNRSCCSYFDSFVELGSEPTASIPPALLSAFSLWNNTQLRFMFFDNKYAGAGAMMNEWSDSLVAEWIENARLATTEGRQIHSNYPGNIEKFIESALISYPVHGKRGCVIGSETPWLEAYLLARGATHITTIEYGVILSTHPQIMTFTPAAVRRRFIDGRLEPFDFCFSYSSLEHSGLGRYGDYLQPFGDFEMLERIRCMLKPNGLFYMGVPTSDTDCLVFNAHRVYGPLRLRLMSDKRWLRIAQFGSSGVGCDQWWFQPTHVWQKQ